MTASTSAKKTFKDLIENFTNDCHTLMKQRKEAKEEIHMVRLNLNYLVESSRKPADGNWYKTTIFKAGFKDLANRIKTVEDKLLEIEKTIEVMKPYRRGFAKKLSEDDIEGIIKKICINSINKQEGFEESHNQSMDCLHWITVALQRFEENAKKWEMSEEQGKPEKDIKNIYLYITKLESLLTLDPFSPGDPYLSVDKSRDQALSPEELLKKQEQAKREKVKDIVKKSIGLLSLSADQDTATKWNFVNSPLFYFRDHIGMRFPDDNRPELLKKIYIDLDVLEKRWMEVWIFFNEPQEMIAGVGPVIAVNLNEGIEAMAQDTAVDEKYLAYTEVTPFNKTCFDIFSIDGGDGDCMDNKGSNGNKYRHGKIDHHFLDILVKMGYGNWDEINKKMKGQIWAKQVIPILGTNHLFPSLEKQCHIIITIPFIDVENDPYGLYRFNDYPEGILLTPCT